MKYYYIGEYGLKCILIFDMFASSNGLLQIFIHFFEPMVAVLILNIIEQAIFKTLCDGIIGYPCVGADGLQSISCLFGYTVYATHNNGFIIDIIGNLIVFTFINRCDRIKKNVLNCCSLNFIHSHYGAVLILFNGLIGVTIEYIFELIFVGYVMNIIELELYLFGYI